MSEVEVVGPKRWRVLELSTEASVAGICEDFNTARIRANDPNDMALFIRRHSAGVTLFFSPMSN